MGSIHERSESLWRIFAILAAFFSSILLMGGCGDKPVELPERTVDRQDQVGSAHVSIISVNHWNKYKESLKPKYELTSKEALELVLPTTAYVGRQASRLRSVGLGIATPSSGTTESLTEKTTDISGTGGASSKTEITSEKKEESKPGDLSQLPQGSDTTPQLTRVLQGMEPDKLQADPMLRYLVATALFQEVKMLETYLDNVADKGAYTPYLVRLKLTLMPSARYRPYDAYMNISFFTKNGRADPSFRLFITGADDRRAPGGTSGSGRRGPDVFPADKTAGKEDGKKDKPSAAPLEAVKRSIDNLNLKLSQISKIESGKESEEIRAISKALKDLVAARNGLAAHRVSGKRYTAEELLARTEELSQRLETELNRLEACLSRTSPCASQPEVIPLVVTDSLEAAFAQRSTADQMSAALDLIAMIKGVGAKLSAKNISQVLNEFAGKDYNSLYSVSRLSANTVRVRMGALRVGSEYYSMMCRSHFLTLLVLVPDECFQEKKSKIALATYTHFINAKTGEEPVARDWKSALATARKALNEFENSNGLEKGCLSQDDKITALLNKIRDNDYRGYVCELEEGLDEQDRKNGKTLIFKDSLWLDLLQTRVGSRYSEDIFNVSMPTQPDPSIECAQTALLYDDPNGNAWTTLSDVVVKDTATAYIKNLCLLPESSAKKKPCQPASMTWKATGFEFDPKNKTLKIFFPSLASWGVATDKNTRLLVNLGGSGKCILPVRYLKKTSLVRRSFHLKAQGEFLLQKDYAAELALDMRAAHCSPDEDKLSIRIANGLIDAIVEGEKQTVQRSPESLMELKVLRIGPAKLRLKGLALGHSVVVQPLINGNPSGEPLTLAVVPPPKTERK